MYLRQAGLTRNPTFSYLYSVRCRGHRAASEAPLERKYSRSNANTHVVANWAGSVDRLGESLLISVDYNDEIFVNDNK